MNNKADFRIKFTNFEDINISGIVHLSANGQYYLIINEKLSPNRNMLIGKEIHKMRKHVAKGSFVIF